MQRFRRMRSFQKFATVHASATNHFNSDRNLTSRAVLKKNRAVALAEWRQLAAALGTGILPLHGLVGFRLTTPHNFQRSSLPTVSRLLVSSLFGQGRIDVGDVPDLDRLAPSSEKRACPKTNTISQKFCSCYWGNKNHNSTWGCRHAWVHYSWLSCGIRYKCRGLAAGRIGLVRDDASLHSRHCSHGSLDSSPGRNGHRDAPC